MTNTLWENSLAKGVQAQKKANLQRELRSIEKAAHPFLFYGGKKMLNLASNNYLGLAAHLYRSTGEEEKTGGIASSRLIIGHNAITKELEEEIALLKRTESALLFPCGYMMNIGVLSCVLNKNDVVLSDQYNHASIVDGIRLSGATCYRYRHLSMDHLEKLLKKASIKGSQRKLIVTETLFSMDGDIAPLTDIIYLKNKYGAALITDEAHADGVYGATGGGLIEEKGVQKEVDLQTGTFTKAYGAYGAYVAGSENWMKYLIHNCRSLIYTTALPTSIVSAIQQSLHLIKQGHLLRNDLHQKSTRFRSTLYKAGLNVMGETHIIPLIIGKAEDTTAFSNCLLEEKIMGVAIRPPTVSNGTSRIRFTLMATSPQKNLDEASNTIIQLSQSLGVI